MSGAGAGDALSEPGRAVASVSTALISASWDRAQAMSRPLDERPVPCPQALPLESPDVKKELRPFHDIVTCDVCGRTILKGEGTEVYLAPGGQRQAVCGLCSDRAEHEGWIRESAHDELPTRGPRPQERRPLLGRLRRRSPHPGTGQSLDADGYGAPAGPEETDPAGTGPNGDPAPARHWQPPQSPRHVRGVPTTAEVKVERALELFNASEHQRTVAGLSRSLGSPWATAAPDPDAPSTVTVLVAWELSWYRYRVDLADAIEPVALQEKGDEVGDIDEELRQWNAGLDAEGRLVIGVARE